MLIAATVAVLVVAGLHAWFMVLEMVLWTRPLGMKTFRLTAERAEATRSLAANQGLYNGFLVAGLVWSAIEGTGMTRMGLALAVFFLACVIVAGVFGAITVGRRILWVQAAPAAVALLLVWLSAAR